MLLHGAEKHLPAQLAIVCLLAAANGDFVSTETLVDAIWGDDPNGGPDNPGDVVRVTINRLRAMGLPIKSRYGRGYAMRLGTVA